MRKMLWWLLILACAFLLLMVLFAGISITFGTEDNGMGTLNTFEEYMIIGVFGLVILLLVFGLVKGIKNVRKKVAAEITPYNKELNINASGQIAYKDYKNMIVRISLKGRFVIYMVVVFVLIAANVYNSASSGVNVRLQDFASIAGFLLFIGMIALLTIVQIKKQYKSNKILNERLMYHLTNEQLEISGETINSILKWEHFYKMRETTNFYLFYHGNITAVIIDKQMFAPRDLGELSEFLKSLKIEHV